MRVLVLGSDGLLGSRIFSELQSIDQLETIGTSRSDSKKLLFNFSCRNLAHLLRLTRPDYVINCIALTSKKSGWLDSIRINSVLPLQLSVLRKIYGYQTVHFSTNAVFSGFRKKYSEKKIPFPTTKYGFTKALGDLCLFNSLVIRTSFIGVALSSSKTHGLVSQLKHRQISESFDLDRDFYWNGVTVDVLVVLIRNLLMREIKLSGLVHFFSADVLIRHEVVRLILEKLEKSQMHIAITHQGNVKNFSLDSDRCEQHLHLWGLAGFEIVPGIAHLLTEMKTTSSPNGV